MTTALVSVLIDTYNYGQFIEQAVDSVLGQDFPPEQMEIVVVDDGSMDDTGERVEKYGDRIRYFRKANGGQASAFNFGIARARGEIVSFLDADDYWLPGKLRHVVDEFEKHPEVGLVYHRLLERRNETEELREARFEWAAVSGFVSDDLVALIRYRVQPTSALAFRRDVLAKLSPIPETIRLQADAYVALLAPLAAPVLAIPDFLAVYRVHGQNLYASEGVEPARERTAQRIAMQRIIAEEVEKWIARNGFDLTRRPVRAFIEQWRLYIEGQEFKLSPPGRIQFLRFLWRKNRCWSSQFGPKLRAINYLNVFGAFITGDERFDVDAWRLKFSAKTKQ